jgi:hypothetical protein
MLEEMVNMSIDFQEETRFKRVQALRIAREAQREVARRVADKRKKEIEAELDMLRDYKDEDMKRSFYMASLQHSIVRSFEQLTLIFQEVKLLEH